MVKPLRLIKYVSKYFHVPVHLLFGLGFAGFYSLTTDNLIFSSVIMAALIGSLLPDIDHLLFYYLYGSKREYSSKAKKYLHSGQLKKYARFCIHNHKDNTGIYSHNLLTFFLVLTIGFVLGASESPVGASLFFSMSSHFAYDMLEDLLFFGRLNPNWFLKFQPTEQVLVSVE